MENVLNGLYVPYATLHHETERIYFNSKCDLFPQPNQEDEPLKES